jgi:hypothetical protein
VKVLYPITVTPAVLVSSSIPVETTYPAFTVGTTYNAGDRVILDGQAVYECLSAGVVGALPLSDAEWLIVRPVNRWAMFDQLPSTSRQQSDTLTITLAVPAVGDVMLLGVVAASVTVALPDVTRTVTLTSTAEQSVYITGLGSAGGNLTITIQPVLIGMSMILRVAEILVGTVIELGETQLGAGVGISDYSTRTIDEYGNASFVRRGYSSFLQATFRLDRDDADTVLDTITALRAVPCVWIGSIHYQCAVIYGYYREAGMEILDAHAECSMRIESLAVDTLTGTVSGGGGGGAGGSGGDGWWSGWTGWEQPVNPPPPPPPPPPPAGDVVLLVRGESWPLADASPVARSIAIAGTMDASSGASPPLFGGTTAIRGLFFSVAPSITATSSTEISADGDFCAEIFARRTYNSPNSFMRLFELGALTFGSLNSDSSIRVLVGGSVVATVTGVVPGDSWNHIAFSRKSGVISAYVNGARVLQYSYATAVTMTTAVIGRTFGLTETIVEYLKYARITVGDSVYDGASFPPLTSGY